jgi:hypothetical protein
MARAYFALQSLAVALFWLVLAVRPQWRVLFYPAAAPEVVLLAFVPGDILILSTGSGAAALLNDARAVLRSSLAWLVAGATLYGTCYTLSLAFTGDTGVLGALLMTPAALGSVFAARVLHDHSRAVSGRGAG